MIATLALLCEPLAIISEQTSSVSTSVRKKSSSSLFVFIADDAEEGFKMGSVAFANRKPAHFPFEPSAGSQLILIC